MDEWSTSHRYLTGKRAFELDFLRGFSIFMMIVHHTVFDLRYLFGVKGLEAEGSFWVDSILRPLFLMIFLGVSGISTSFSRNNVARGVRLLIVAIIFSLSTWFLNAYVLPGFGVIYFNVLHVIALTTLFYAFLVRREKTEEDKKKTDAKIVIIACLIIFFGLTLPLVPDLQSLRSYWLLPFGFRPLRLQILDYMPLLPWSGVYLLGTLIGRGLYEDRRSRFDVRPGTIKALSPFLFMGRHALIVYLLHQPVVYGVLTLIQMLFQPFPGR